MYVDFNTKKYTKLENTPKFQFQITRIKHQKKTLNLERCSSKYSAYFWSLRDILVAKKQDCTTVWHLKAESALKNQWTSGPDKLSSLPVQHWESWCQR